jgi:hypothetical protein
MGPLMMRYYFQLSEASAMRDPVEVRACVNESVDSKPSSIDYDVAPRSPIGRKLYLSLQNTILWHCLWRSPAGTRTDFQGWLCPRCPLCKHLYRRIKHIRKDSAS